MRTFATTASLAIAPLLLAAPAMGQAINIRDDAGGLAIPGQVITISMEASYGGSDYAVAGIATSLIINEAQGEFSNLRLVAPMDGPGTAAGVIGAGSIDGILAGQLNFPTAGIFADPANPIGFWEADFRVNDTLSGLTVLDVQTQTSRYDVYINRDSATSQSRLADLEEGSLIIAVPAPASGLALVAGLAMAGRRRR
ncbi:MAG: hypothetical protein RIB58_14100 [Phycisphaerales bacterium]